jgi:hypothetical protein
MLANCFCNIQFLLVIVDASLEGGGREKGEGGIEEKRRGREKKKILSLPPVA